MDYDYIIIGAGSAGCVLANRLSKDPSVNVLLVEAGGKDNKPEIHIPAGYFKLHHSSVDWNCYYTLPQKHLDGRKIYHPRGKVLGGCSSTNAMVYIRGQREDYDTWRDEGNANWGFNDVLPYFLNPENNEQFNNAFHSQGGEMNITQALWHRSTMAKAFVQACLDLGMPYNEDFNGKTQEGAGWFQFTMKNAMRQSVAKAFLVPALKRKNLHILTRAHVKSILIEKQKAKGIEVMTGNETVERLWSKKEVILCAGAFASPQLLMLSGVGPQNGLKKMGISCNTPLEGVGQNLQDHLFFPVSSLCKKGRGNNSYLSTFQQGLQTARYLITRKGPYSIGPLEACAFVKSSPTLPRADIQFQFTPTHVGDDYSTDVYDLTTFPRTNGCTVLPTQLRPLSRGYVGIESPSPFHPPVIDPQYLSSEKDRYLMVKACRLALDVLEQKAFDGIRERTHCPSIKNSDDDLLRHIQKSAECVYHPVGTCKMGTGEDAVVDETLRVHGLDNLRVVDASIMPSITSGNTNAPVIMIAEKAAAMITGEKRQNTSR